MAATQKKVSKAMLQRREEALRLTIPRRMWTERTGFPLFRNNEAPRSTGPGAGIWNFWRDGVTPSMLKAFDEDRKGAELKYVQGWTARSEGMGIAFGNCMHRCLEWVYDEFPKITEKNVFDGSVDNTTLKVACDTFVVQYKHEWAASHPDPTTETLQQQELVYGIAQATLPSYIKRWSGDFWGKYDFMPNPSSHPVTYEALEGEFKVPYVYPDGMCVWLRGKRDMKFRDSKSNKFVLDTKCLSVISDRDIINMFPVDLQQNCYLLADLIDTGEMALGVIKNVIRRSAHKRKKDESLPDFLKRMAEDIADAKQWDVKGPKGETTGWFARFEMQTSETELLDWKANWLDPLMQDVRMWVEGITPNYPTEGGMAGKYGTSDVFEPIVNSNYNNLYQRSKPFPELD